MGIEADCSEDEILNKLAEYKEKKYMRRFAAVMNHRHAGYKANAMGVWAVPEEQCEEMGPLMAGFSAVSHCYKRPTYDDWPYSIFTMIHGHKASECEETVAAIAAETGVSEYTLLWSIKEYKKVRIRYFTPEWDAYIDKYADQLS
jgi:DNA-binding Lrp family transcriptional regulator